MSEISSAWFEDWLDTDGVYSERIENHRPSRFRCLQIRESDWAHAAHEARRLDMRLVAVWAAEGCAHDITAAGDSLYAYMAVVHREHGYILLRTELCFANPVLPSISAYYIGACRMERTIQDLFGIVIANSPDSRAWVKHEHWAINAYPLRSTFEPQDTIRPEPGQPVTDYPYVRCASPGVYEIPVGPVHAGIIEPGHFRFLAVGEQILNMEERLGYVHKGIERTMQGRRAEEGVKLAARVSGDTSVGHAWAFVRACENASGVEVPRRASYLRGLLCERERMANHIGDIGAVCNDAAFGFMQAQMQRLREEMARLHRRCFGHRLLMDTIIPGGVAGDLDTEQVEALKRQTREMAEEVASLRHIYEENPSIQERVIGSGSVSLEDAHDIGLLGFAGRASGDRADVRLEERYAPYDELEVGVALGKGGDVAARVDVRFEEIAFSAQMVTKLLDGLPEGDILTGWQPPEVGVSGFAAIEGWRGEVVAWVRFGVNGLIDRCFVRDPSVINWLGLELAVRDVPVPDFPLNNKSFNCSYSGNDL